MRSKTPLALMEQVVMVLVFALAASLCLRVFVFSNQTSERNKDIDRAVLLAQNAAEAIKAHGSIGEAAGSLGGEISQGSWHSCYLEDLTPAPTPEDSYFRVDVLPFDSGVDGLGQADVSVSLSNGSETLFSLTVAWQEVAGNG